jgi:hypothetical protein
MCAVLQVLWLSALPSRGGQGEKRERQRGLVGLPGKPGLRIITFTSCPGHKTIYCTYHPPARAVSLSPSCSLSVSTDNPHADNANTCTDSSVVRPVAGGLDNMWFIVLREVPSRRCCQEPGSSWTHVSARGHIAQGSEIGVTWARRVAPARFTFS